MLPTRSLRNSDGPEVFETTFGEDRGIVTCSRERAPRDAQVRAEILDRIRAKLAAKKKVSAKTFTSIYNQRFLLKSLERGGFPATDDAKIAEASKKDGFFAIVTHIHDESGEWLIAQCRELWSIEDAFGELKARSICRAAADVSATVSRPAECSTRSAPRTVPMRQLAHEHRHTSRSEPLWTGAGHLARRLLKNRAEDGPGSRARRTEGREAMGALKAHPRPQPKRRSTRGRRGSRPGP